MMGRYHSRNSVRVVTLAFALAVLAAACGGGGDSDSDVLGSSSSSTSTTRADASSTTTVDSSFEDAPAIVASLQPPDERDTVPTAFPLPAGYLDSPTADEATITEEAEDRVQAAVSPNGVYAAKIRKPDAVKTGAVEIFDVKTGRKIEDAAYDGQTIQTAIEWAPDGSGLRYRDEVNWYVHQVEGQTAKFPGNERRIGYAGVGGWTSNDDAVAIIGCNAYSEIVRMSSSDPDGAVDLFGGDSGCGAAQLLDGEGNPTVVASLGPDLYTVDTGDPPAKVFSTGAPARSTQAFRQCDGLAVVSSSQRIGSDERPLFVYVGETQKAVALPAGTAFPLNLTCPIPSPDQSRFAIATEAGPVLVVDAATGTNVEISRTGTPISWNADGDQVLVSANGLFVAEADGSGAEPASVELSTSTYNDGRYCRAGDSGYAMLQTETDVVIYDVGRDKAVRTDSNRIDETCSTTPDGRWLLTGQLIVDLEEGRSATLPFVNTETGLRNDQAPSLGGSRWYGPQQILGSSGPSRPSS